MSKSILIIIAVILLALNFTRKDINATAWATPPYDHKEKFSPALSSLNSLDKLEIYTDKVLEGKHVKLGSIEYVEAISNIVSERFYHGFSHQSVGQNWVASIGEKLFGYGLSCNVDPNEIVKYPNAACSQQCIVMMELLRRKQIDYRRVGFPHHYAIEAKINGEWNYFDPNMEPNIPGSERLESKWRDSADNLKQYYDNSRFTDLDYKFGNHLAVTFGAVNERPAQNARLFQSATGFFCRIAWILPLLVLAFRSRRSVANAFSFSKQKEFIQSLWLFLSGKQKYKFI